MNSRERIAYLRGLLDSMPGDEKVQKICFAVAEALDALAVEIAEQGKRIDLQREHYEGLVDELDELHDAVYELEEAMGMDSEEDMEEDGSGDEDGEGLEEVTESYISMTCPACAYSFYYRYEEDKENEKLICPSCGEEFNRSL
ncbi:MAG: transposase [Synergistaceae bacterium]|nr:transposase [Synergistaceae bacterium]